MSFKPVQGPMPGPAGSAGAPGARPSFDAGTMKMPAAPSPPKPPAAPARDAAPPMPGTPRALPEMAGRTGAELQSLRPQSLPPEAQQGMKAFLKGTRDVIGRLMKEFPKKLQMDGLFGKHPMRSPRDGDSVHLQTGRTLPEMAKRSGEELKKFNKTSFTPDRKQAVTQFHDGTKDVIRRLRTDFPSKLETVSLGVKAKGPEISPGKPSPAGETEGAAKAAAPPKPAVSDKPPGPAKPALPSTGLGGRAEAPKAPEPPRTPEPSPKTEKPREEAAKPPQEAKPGPEAPRAPAPKMEKPPEPRAPAAREPSEPLAPPREQSRPAAPPAQQEALPPQPGPPKQAPLPPMEQQAQQSLFLQRPQVPVQLPPHQFDQPVLGHLRGPELETVYEDEPRPGYFKRHIMVDESEEESLEGEVRGFFDGSFGGDGGPGSSFLEGAVQGCFQGECDDAPLCGYLNGDYSGSFRGQIVMDLAPSTHERDFSQPVIEVLGDGARCNRLGDAAPGQHLVQGHLAGAFKGTVRRSREQPMSDLIA